MPNNLFLDDMTGSTATIKPVLFHPAPVASDEVAVPAEVAQLLDRDCVVALGCSGGKDSQALALAVARHLDKIGHTGPRVLVHADLGRIEWKASLPVCERLAEHLGWELMVVRRAAGDLMARWQGRWANNVARYADLSCVKLILPWSTPALRFCTSESKTQVISGALRKRFPKHNIVNATGIRHQESTQRSRMPVSAVQSNLARKGYVGMTWNAIIGWDIGSVFQEIFNAGLEPHEAYAKYGSSRVSCVLCIMSSAADMQASLKCEENQPVYRELVELEALSTYGFQGSRWLADVRPGLLSEDLRARAKASQEAAIKRQALEAQIPKHLLFSKGWPEMMPTPGEAELLAFIRSRVSTLVGIQARYLTPDGVMARYAVLLEEKSAVVGPVKRRRGDRAVVEDLQPA